MSKFKVRVQKEYTFSDYYINNSGEIELQKYLMTIDLKFSKIIIVQHNY